MPYATGLSDERWALIDPLVTAWKQERVARSATGDPGSCDLREVVNALLYQNRTGCQWRLLPHDLPAWSAVFYYFTLWRQDGLDQRIQEILRRQVRERARRLGDPSLVITDTQSVRVAAGVPRETTELDANKRATRLPRSPRACRSRPPCASPPPSPMRRAGRPTDAGDPGRVRSAAAASAGTRRPRGQRGRPGAAAAA